MAAAVLEAHEGGKARATRTLIEGLAQMDREEEARHQEKLRRWQADWDTQESQLKGQESLAQIDKDVRRSGVLACGVAEALTMRELAKTAKLTPGYISFLLKYHRFNSLYTTVYKIPEARFRAYWHQIRDPYFTKRKGKEVEDYEQKVFADIAAMIEAGTPPVPKPKAGGGTVPAKGQRHATRREAKALLVLKQQQVREAYTMIEEDIKALIELSGADRSRWSPEWLANHARRLRQGFMLLQKALKGEVDSWLVETADETTD
jgi:hypothetical protein